MKFDEQNYNSACLVGDVHGNPSVSAGSTDPGLRLTKFLMSKSVLFSVEVGA